MFRNETSTNSEATNSNNENSEIFGPPCSPTSHNIRPRISIISPRLRKREELKKILLLSAEKLAKMNKSKCKFDIRRSVCIYNLYCRLSDELCIEKARWIAANRLKCASMPTPTECETTPQAPRSISEIDQDLERLERELNAIDASMPLLDNEIIQGAEQLEKATSRKRTHSEDNDKQVLDALSLLWAPDSPNEIDECPSSPEKRRRDDDCSFDIETDQTYLQSNVLEFDIEIFLEQIRINDNWSQAAVISETSPHPKVES